MLHSLSLWRWRARLLGCLVPGVLALVGPAGAAPMVLPPLGSPVPNVQPRYSPIALVNDHGSAGHTAATRTNTAPPASVTALDLAACRQLALQQQPAIAAARSSLAAAIVRQQSLDNLHVPTCLARDLPTRRKQAALGVVIAQAYLQQVELNTLYGVNYSYLTYLYAKRQVNTADRAIESLTYLRGLVQGARERKEKEIRRDVSERDTEKLDAYLGVAKGRREEALQGAERALSALREAIGLCPDYLLVIAQDGLPEPTAVPDRHQIIALAVSRRPEMVQAINGAEVTGLEVCAQASKRCQPTVPTFASGGDIHANPLPAGSYDDNYRPGAIGPEMPPTFTGRRCDRVEQARVYTARAEAVIEKTRNLLTLEADQAFFRWRESTNKMGHYKAAAAKSGPLYKALITNFAPLAPGPEPKVGTVYERPFVPMLEAAVLDSQVRFLVEEAHYRQLIALAELERITAGAFSACLDTAPAASQNGNARNNGTANNNRLTLP